MDGLNFVGMLESEEFEDQRRSERYGFDLASIVNSSRLVPVRKAR
jgi:hypothetical protein